MTSSDFKTRKQDLVADLNRLKALRFGDGEVIKSLGVLVKTLEAENRKLKTSNRELARASQMARCTCPCCADGCDACKKSLAAERKAAKL